MLAGGPGFDSQEGSGRIRRFVCYEWNQAIEEKGLRVEYHAQVRYVGALRGRERLPPLAELKRVLEAGYEGGEARVLERSWEQGIAQCRAATADVLPTGG